MARTALDPGDTPQELASVPIPQRLAIPVPLQGQARHQGHEQRGHLQAGHEQSGHEQRRPRLRGEGIPLGEAHPFSAQPSPGHRSSVIQSSGELTALPATGQAPGGGAKGVGRRVAPAVSRTDSESSGPLTLSGHCDLPLSPRDGPASPALPTATKGCRTAPSSALELPGLLPGWPEDGSGLHAQAGAAGACACSQGYPCAGAPGRPCAQWQESARGGGRHREQVVMRPYSSLKIPSAAPSHHALHLNRALSDRGFLGKGVGPTGAMEGRGARVAGAEGVGGWGGGSAASAPVRASGGNPQGQGSGPCPAQLNSLPPGPRGAATAGNAPIPVQPRAMPQEESLLASMKGEVLRVRAPGLHHCASTESEKARESGRVGGSRRVGASEGPGNSFISAQAQATKSEQHTRKEGRKGILKNSASTGTLRVAHYSHGRGPASDSWPVEVAAATAAAAAPSPPSAAPAAATAAQGTGGRGIMSSGEPSAAARSTKVGPSGTSKSPHRARRASGAPQEGAGPTGTRDNPAPSAALQGPAALAGSATRVYQGCGPQVPQSKHAQAKAGAAAWRVEGGPHPPGQQRPVPQPSRGSERSFGASPLRRTRTEGRHQEHERRRAEHEGACTGHERLRAWDAGGEAGGFAGPPLRRTVTAGRERSGPAGSMPPLLRRATGGREERGSAAKGPRSGPHCTEAAGSRAQRRRSLEEQGGVGVARSESVGRGLGGRQGPAPGGGDKEPPVKPLLRSRTGLPEATRPHHATASAWGARAGQHPEACAEGQKQRQSGAVNPPGGITAGAGKGVGAQAVHPDPSGQRMNEEELMRRSSTLGVRRVAVHPGNPFRPSARSDQGPQSWEEQRASERGDTRHAHRAQESASKGAQQRREPARAGEGRRELAHIVTHTYGASPEASLGSSPVLSADSSSATDSPHQHGPLAPAPLPRAHHHGPAQKRAGPAHSAAAAPTPGANAVPAQRPGPGQAVRSSSVRERPAGARGGGSGNTVTQPMAVGAVHAFSSGSGAGREAQGPREGAERRRARDLPALKLEGAEGTGEACGGTGGGDLLSPPLVRSLTADRTVRAPVPPISPHSPHPGSARSARERGAGGGAYSDRDVAARYSAFLSGEDPVPTSAPYLAASTYGAGPGTPPESPRGTSHAVDCGGLPRRAGGVLGTGVSGEDCALHRGDRRLPLRDASGGVPGFPRNMSSDSLAASGEVMEEIWKEPPEETDSVPSAGALAESGLQRSSSLRKMLSAISPKLPKAMSVFKEETSDGSEGALSLARLPLGKRSQSIKARGPRVFGK